MANEAKAWERMQKAIFEGIQESARLDSMPVKRNHSESCAYHAGGDCTCGLTPWPEDLDNVSEEKPLKLTYMPTVGRGVFGDWK